MSRGNRGRRLARAAARLAAACLLTTVTGCFQQFEEYRQLALPARPAGAVTTPAGPPDEVFPLQVGGRYDYAARFGLGTGMFSGTAVISVVDSWLLGNRRVDQAMVVSSYFGRTRRDPYAFVREPHWIGLFEKDPPDKVTFFMPTRLQLDQRWEVVTGEGTGQAHVEAIEPVQVPAGRFPATWRVRYINAGAHTDMTLWLAPRVGLVKAEVLMYISLLPLRGTLTLAHREAPVGNGH